MGTNLRGARGPDVCVGGRVCDDRVGDDVPVFGLVAVLGKLGGRRDGGLIEAVSAVAVEAETHGLQLLRLRVD